MNEQTTVECDHGTNDGAEGSMEQQRPQAQERDREKAASVTESIRYRRRAQAAERELEQLKSAYEQVRQSLDETKQTLEAVERRRRVDELLIDSETIDLEAARLLTEAAIEAMDEPDVEAAVSELRRRRPYLFRRSERSGGGAMSGKSRGANGGSGLDEAARAAVGSGDRRDLLRYLRMRRRG